MAHSTILHHADSVLFTLYMATLGCVVFLATGPLQNAHFWQSYTPDPGPWCERDRVSSFVREPSNAYTDFTFLAAGLYMISRATHDIRRIRGSSTISSRSSGGPAMDAPLNLLRCNPLLSILFGAANVFHAVGTFTNHACRCLEGHTLDVAGMYSIIFLILAYQILTYVHASIEFPGNATERSVAPHLFNLSDKAMLAFVGLYGLGVLGLYQISQLPYSDPRCAPRETMVVAAMVVAVLAFRFLYARRVRSLSSAKTGRIVLATVLLIAAFVVHQLDVAKVLCNPDSIVQGHALWHVLACFSLLTVYKFYYDEDFRVAGKSA